MGLFVIYLLWIINSKILMITFFGSNIFILYSAIHLFISYFGFAQCMVGQISEFAKIRDFQTENWYVASLVHSQIKIKSFYWMIFYWWFRNYFLFVFPNALEMPDTIFLSESLGLSQTHLLAQRTRLLLWNLSECNTKTKV